MVKYIILSVQVVVWHYLVDTCMVKYTILSVQVVLHYCVAWVAKDQPKMGVG